MRRRPRRQVWLIGGAILGVVVLASVAVGFWSRSDRHIDGGGALGSEGAPVHLTQDLNPLGGTITTWTFGIRLCLATGSTPAILEGISPDPTIGDGFRFLGASVREFDYDPLAHTFIYSVEGYPPPTATVPDPLHDIDGFPVTTPCTRPPSGRYTELLVGLGLAGPDGGGWQGVDIAYTVDGRHQVLVLEHDLEICGTATPCT